MHPRVLIIAEAGVNHNGDIALAKQLIEVAAQAGADYVKFQTFKAEKLVSTSAPKAAYQERNMQEADSQLEMIKKYELDLGTHHELMEHCQQKGIKFLSTPFDFESIDLLHELGIDLFKIPSGEITNKPHLEKIASLGKPIILSTGMSNLAEIEAALEVLEKAGANRHDISILHCNTEYPTPMRDVNLLAMDTIAQAFQTPVGYSDHTLGIEVSIAAVARGAVCIEKHFTLSRDLEGPDHKASLEPEELKAMVSAIRNIELAMGTGIKKASPSEEKNKIVARKSIHLQVSLNAGDTIQEEHLIMMRPGSGISPMDSHLVLGKKARKDLIAGQLLSLNDLL